MAAGRGNYSVDLEVEHLPREPGSDKDHLMSMSSCITSATGQTLARGSSRSFLAVPHLFEKSTIVVPVGRAECINQRREKELCRLAELAFITSGNFMTTNC